MPDDPFAPLDGTIADICRLRGESRSTVRRKIRSGAYESYIAPGGKVRRVILASVYAERQRAIDAKLVMPKGPTRGRPRIHADRTLTAAERKARWKERHKRPPAPAHPPAE